MHRNPAFHRFLGVACLILAGGSGCNSEKYAAEQKAKLEAERTEIRQEIAGVDREIAALERQKKEIDTEKERWEQRWRASVLSRHPDWTPEKQKRQLAILDLKWEGSNRLDDAETVDGMKRHGSRYWYDVELVEADYWDMARARQYRLSSHDLYRNVYKRLEPLESKKRSLVERQRRSDTPGNR